jgi:hypothetical protein
MDKPFELRRAAAHGGDIKFPSCTAARVHAEHVRSQHNVGRMEIWHLPSNSRLMVLDGLASDGQVRDWIEPGASRFLWS